MRVAHAPRDRSIPSYGVWYHLHPEPEQAEGSGRLVRPEILSITASMNKGRKDAALFNLYRCYSYELHVILKRRELLQHRSE